MQGALRITYIDGREEYFEVDAIGNVDNFVQRLKAFLASPNVTIVLDDEFLIIPSTSIRQISITRAPGELDVVGLEPIPGVVLNARRVLG